MVAPRSSDARTPDVELSLRPDNHPPLFANLLTAQMCQEEFLITLAFLNPEAGIPVKGSVLGRFVVTPAHAKRIVQVLAEQVARHEALYGQMQDEASISQAGQLGH